MATQQPRLFRLRYKATIQLNKRYRLELATQMTDTQRRLLTAYAQGWARLQDNMQVLSTQYARLLAEGQNTRLVLLEMKSTQALLTQVEDELVGFADWARYEIHDSMGTAAQVGAGYAQRMVESELAGTGVRFHVLERGQVEQMVAEVADETAIGRGLAMRFGPVVENVKRELIAAMVTGVNPREVARVLKNEYGAGAVSALRTARTYIIRSATLAQSQFYAKCGVCTAMERHCDFGKRTCLTCILLDGKREPVGAPLEDHWCGRCTWLPVTLTYQDLGISAPDPGAGRREARQTGKDWFLSQPDSMQKAIMGEKAHWFWKNGYITDINMFAKQVTDPVLGKMWTTRSLKELVPHWRDIWRDAHKRVVTAGKEVTRAASDMIGRVTKFVGGTKDQMAEWLHHNFIAGSTYSGQGLTQLKDTLHVFNKKELTGYCRGFDDCARHAPVRKITQIGHYGKGNACWEGGRRRFLLGTNMDNTFKTDEYIGTMVRGEIGNSWVLQTGERVYLRTLDDLERILADGYFEHTRAGERLGIWRDQWRALHEGRHDFYGAHSGFGFKDTSEATLRHEWGHAFHTERGSEIITFLGDRTPEVHEMPIYEVEGYLAKKYAPTLRGRDSFHECIAENFCLYSAGKTSHLHPDIISMFNHLTKWTRH